jgi:unsaturated rhamnogalacturonyl hydrolase
MFWAISLFLAAAAALAQTTEVPAGVTRSALGVTRKATPIECWITADDLDYNTRKTRILLLGGLDRSAASADAVRQAMRWFYTAPEAKSFRGAFAVSAVPAAAPDGETGGDPARGYPPAGEAYSSPAEPEAAYLWRWIGMHAPDLVVDVRPGSRLSWSAPEAPAAGLVKVLAARSLPAGDDLVSQVVRVAPSNTGTVPALRVEVPSGENGNFLRSLLTAVPKANFRGPSPARAELQRRLDRTPLVVARQLSVHYGQDLDQAVYIPAMALVGRLWLGELTADRSHLADVETIVEPYFSSKKPSLGERPSGSHFSGHLVFGELYRLTKKPRYLELAKAAADLGFDASGAPRESMPNHNEMSDAVFMGCPILVQVGRLTGDRKYFDMALRHLRFMLKLNLRPDGLHRHSPLDEAAWGRGNGFPALGLALSLTELPEDYAGRAEMLQAFRAHMEALVRHQDPTGAWRQVIDHPGSYRELTATSMIAFAMARGVRSGWLDRDRFDPVIRKAWYAARTRIGPDGGLVDVCTGTGKQKTLRDYFDRTAILGPDPRGGAMSLLIATEMERYERAAAGR